jgi:hypothetical protein
VQKAVLQSLPPGSFKKDENHLQLIQEIEGVRISRHEKAPGSSLEITTEEVDDGNFFGLSALHAATSLGRSQDGHGE